MRNLTRMNTIRTQGSSTCCSSRRARRTSFAQDDRGVGFGNAECGMLNAECQEMHSSLPQFPQPPATNRSAICACDSCKKSKKRFVDLRAVGFFGQEHVCDALHQRHEDCNQQRPTPGPLGTERSQKHCRRQHKQRGEKKVAKLYVEKSRTHSEKGSEDVDAAISLVCHSQY